MVPRRDSNPYSLWPLPPQGSVSTNSTTSAKTLLPFFHLRQITRSIRRLALLEHRHILNRWLADRHFQHSWIRQPRLGQLISLLLGEKRQTQAGQKNAGKYSSKPTQKGSRTLASETVAEAPEPKDAPASAPCPAAAAPAQPHQEQPADAPQSQQSATSVQFPRRDRSHRIHPLSEGSTNQPPSISAMANSSAALSAFTLPPYSNLTPSAMRRSLRAS